MTDSKDKYDPVKVALQSRRKLEIYSYTLTCDWGLAEDAVQEAFVVLYKKQENLGENDNIYGWMKKIVRDKSIDIIRKRKKFTSMDSELMDLVENSFNSHESNLKHEKLKTMHKALEDCMSHLNNEDLQIIQKFYLHKFSCEKIADQISSSVNAIRLRLSRLRAKLRKCSNGKLENLGEAW
ncbi:MAG: sigma-70 family RNA polymerase sigma factor [Lentisphaeraceae bacterium]|nr:sigma-70 family RNA polymerase sigma factor [Lentisphaeraceae bacterium]